MPTLDDIDVAVQLVGDMSQGMQIHDTDVIGGQGDTGAISSFSNGKQKEVPTGPTPNARSRSPSNDVGGSTDQSALLEKKRMLFHSDGTSIGGPPSLRQQVPSKATMG
jgi:hypothetical protein